MVEIWMMSAKIATSRLPKITFSGNRGYDVTASVHDVTKNFIM